MPRAPLGNPENPYPLADPPKVGEIMHLPTGTMVSEAQMLAVASDARIVYVGETHDNPAAHRVQLAVLKAMSRTLAGSGQSRHGDADPAPSSRSSTAGLPANWTRRSFSSSPTGIRSGVRTSPFIATC